MAQPTGSRRFVSASGDTQSDGLDEDLLAELNETIDDEKIEAFVEGIWRIGDSTKDLGSYTGDTGEVLSSHPDKDLVEGFTEYFDNHDEYVVVPAHDNMAKWYQVTGEKNPEIDK